MEICIVDYGFGNIWSLKNAINYLGYECRVTSNPEEVLRAKKLFLPGVGAFKSAMIALEKLGLSTAILDSVTNEGSKVLGICLGMQLMAEAGTENGLTPGLGLIKGQIERLPSFVDTNVTHIGFNEVEIKSESCLFRGLPNRSDFYFVHSYQLTLPPPDGISAFTNYGGRFVSAFESENVFATQFHPEKSQSNGLILLKNFLELPNA
jgi:imidazole glycerol-phosphate synthase subunit HisH